MKQKTITIQHSRIPLCVRLTVVDEDNAFRLTVERSDSGRWRTILRKPFDTLDACEAVLAKQLGIARVLMTLTSGGYKESVMTLQHFQEALI